MVRNCAAAGVVAPEPRTERTARAAARFTAFITATACTAGEWGHAGAKSPGRPGARRPRARLRPEPSRDRQYGIGGAYVPVCARARWRALGRAGRAARRIARGARAASGEWRVRER